MMPQPAPSRRGFRALVVTQFLGAFTDNAFLAFCASLFMLRFDMILAIPVFIAPFLIFSLHAGRVADKFSKRTVILATRIGCFLILLLATPVGCHLILPLAERTGYDWLLTPYHFAALLLGITAAYFGPSKYGIIPELVPEHRISGANGFIQLSTIAAILLGQAGGMMLAKSRYFDFYPALNALAALAAAGALASLFITPVKAADPLKSLAFRPFHDLAADMRAAGKDTVLWLAILGTVFFWLVGALLVIALPAGPFTALYLAMAAGLGIGGYLAGVLSGGKVEYGLIPLGALGIAAGSLGLALLDGHYFYCVAAAGILGAGGGFFVIPLYAILQQRPLSASRGAIQGLSYLLSSAAVLCAVPLFVVFTGVFDLPHASVLFFAFAATLAVTAYAVHLVPDSLVRLLLWLLTHTLYRIRVVGRANLPSSGGALLVANHMSFADALFVLASTDRQVRFVVYRGVYEMPAIKPFARLMHAIPLAADDAPRELIHALREASNGIRGGDIVCIFAEGQITRIGQMLPFRQGFERIMKGVDAPIIPVHLDRIWGSIFSFEKGRFIWKWPRRIPYPITVSYGAPMSPSSGAAEVRQAVQGLATEAFHYRREEMRPLHRAFIAEARRRPWRFAMADDSMHRVSFLVALARSVALARAMKGHWGTGEMTGLLLPPSVTGACLNIAALLAGKVPVNLNYTVSQESFDSAVSQCGITTVVASRAFVEKIKVSPRGEVVFLENLAPRISKTDRVLALAMALLLPARLLERASGAKRRWALDDLATVIFSSGSTGDPKGVMLSHYNIHANLEGIAQVMRTEPRDRVLGVLPFFHSFGFTGTLFFPLVKGFGAVYHPNPMDARLVGELAARHRATIFVATPTFLQSYIRRVEPGKFGSLRFVLTGAEKLPDRVADAFEEKFGIRPYEAYGCTECAPAVTVNTAGYRAPGFHQVGGKHGRIGHPLPGISVRIVDPDTMQPLPTGRPGLLLVKGPNVMRGYLGNPEKTAEVLTDGWYRTGDIAALDEDGFLVITDRLSRFAKIGGEMVPLVRIEEKLHELAGLTQQALAVAAVPDEKKGERLVVLHTLDEAAIATLLAALPASGLPNLWIPRPEAFRRIDALPVLGTGKLDLRRINKLARE